MSGDGDNGTSRPARQIYNVQERARIIQSRYWNTAMYNSETGRALHDLRSVLLDYYKALRPYAESSEMVNEEWSDIEAIGAPDFDSFYDWATSETTTERSKPGLGRGKEVTQIKRINLLSGEEADRIIEKLHGIAIKLGFGSELEQREIRTEIVPEPADAAADGGQHN